MHQGLGAGSARSLGDGAGASHVHGLEGLPPRLGENADQVHHRIGALDSTAHAVGKAHVGLHGMDLADRPHRLQMPGKIGPAHRGADAPAVGRQRPHGMPADEPRAAEYRDQASLLQPRDHACLPPIAPSGEQ